MGKLDSVIASMPKEPSNTETTVLALMSNFNALLTKSMQEQGVAERLAAEIRREFKEVGGSLDGALSKSLSEAVEEAVGAIQKEIISGVVSNISEAVGALEAAVIAEIRAIPQPKIPRQTKTDLKPVVKAVTDAIQGIDIPAPIVQEAIEKKTQWTFEFKRNSRTGLLEEVIARSDRAV